MPQFAMYTPETAPEGAGQALTRLKESAGLIPNLAAQMAGSPALIDGFVTLREVYQARATLDPREREILGLTNAVTNGCAWCVAFHSFVADRLKVDPSTVAAIRAGRQPAELRARALHAFAVRLNQTRGRIEPRDLEAFLAAGFTQPQALEVVAGLAMSLMANYAGNFVQPQLDPFLTELTWSAAA
jgi:uncharacterized peroxidase-related enzyme